MDSAFRTALIWHMEQDGTSIADLVKNTGISRDVINKLKARPDSSTTVENGLLIASYYGKTLNQFVSLVPATQFSRLEALLGMLSPEELRIVTAQVAALAGH